MLRLAWLTIPQHVFQPALTGRLELISRKIVSCKPGTKAIAVSRFREKLSPANWVQNWVVISRKIARSWVPKNGVQHGTAIYPIPRYTRQRYIGSTLYTAVLKFDLENSKAEKQIFVYQCHSHEVIETSSSTFSQTYIFSVPNI